VHDAGERVVLGGGGDLDLERSGAVDGSGIHLGAGSSLHGDGLSGDGRDVQGGAAGADGAVGGEPFPGLDHHGVAHDQVGRVDNLLDSGPSNRRPVGYQGQQGAQPAARLGQGVLLETLAEGVQEGERGGLGELTEDHRPDGGDRHQGADTDLAPGQLLQGLGHEGARPDHQGGDVQSQRPPVQTAQLQQEGGQQERSRYEACADLADTPDAGDVVVVELGGGLIGAAGVAHRELSSCVVRVIDVWPPVGPRP